MSGVDVEKLRALAGQAGWPRREGREEVTTSRIRDWCDAVEDTNPNYLDPELAAGSAHGGIVAPPAMLQAWTMPGFGPASASYPKGGFWQAMQMFDEAGFTSVVATDCDQEYMRYLRPGDRLSTTSELESISEQKETALGTGHFVTMLHTYHDQNDEVVGTMRFRLLRFKPRARPSATEASRKPARQRPRPGITHDNKFFWDGVKKGKLLIQRCAACQRLRHPPAPMCPQCHSFETEAVEACGRGIVYSYVVAHHPPAPPFEYPHAVALIELEEGTRLVSNLVGVDPAAVRIGMPVQLEFKQIDDELTLPQFRPIEESL